MSIVSRALVRFSLAAGFVVCSAAAGEHHGAVQFAGLPVPGAIVTAVQGGKKLTTVTAASGAYSFPDLADGQWSVQVEMLCFAPLKRDVTAGPGEEAPVFDLKLLPMEEIRAIAPLPMPESAPVAASRPVSATA